jgi:hypothetical protein
MPKTVKVDLATAIPEEVYDKIATEEDAIDVADLKAWLKKVKHPIVEKFWKDGEPVPLAVPPPGKMWPGDEDYLPVAAAISVAADGVEESDGVVVL